MDENKLEFGVSALDQKESQKERRSLRNDAVGENILEMTALKDDKRRKKDNEVYTKNGKYMDEEGEEAEGVVSLSCRWSGKVIQLTFTPTDFETFTFGDLKTKIENELSIPISKQKLLGILPPIPSITRLPPDDALLSELRFTRAHSFLLVGTPSGKGFIEPSDLPSRPFVINDLAWDYEPAANSETVVRTPANLRRLQRAISSTEIRLIHPPRANKKLLVLDLDYTLLDCKPADPLTGRQQDVFDMRSARERGGGKGSRHASDRSVSTSSPSVDEVKRPYLEFFMETVYEHYDIAIWSQTHWRWVEIKCTELGLLTSNKFNISFVLDRSSMFSVSSQRDGRALSHEVKALEIIWAKFSRTWGRHNTLHVDDLSRNFAFNPKNGVKVSAYRVSKRAGDHELFHLAGYLTQVSQAEDVTAVDHTQWKKLMETADPS